MPEWQAAATTPDLLDIVRQAIAANTLEVKGSDDDRHTRRPADRIEKHAKRTARQVLDRYLADGMPASLAVTMTTSYLANGGDQTIYRVRKLDDQRAYDTRTERAKFAGLYHSAPRRHRSVTIGETPKGDTSGRIAKPHRLAEQWRAMRR